MFPFAHPLAPHPHTRLMMSQVARHTCLSPTLFTASASLLTDVYPVQDDHAARAGSCGCRVICNSLPRVLYGQFRPTTGHQPRAER